MLSRKWEMDIVEHQRMLMLTQEVLPVQLFRKQIFCLPFDQATGLYFQSANVVSG